MKPVYVALTIFLTGCIPIPIPIPAPAPVIKSGLVAQEPDSCGAVELHSLIGQNEGMIRTVRTKGGYRIIRPGGIVTQDYNGERLNLYVDAKGITQELSCG
jgi:hypothetical protein